VGVVIGRPVSVEEDSQGLLVTDGVKVGGGADALVSSMDGPAGAGVGGAGGAGAGAGAGAWVWPASWAKRG